MFQSRDDDTMKVQKFAGVTTGEIPALPAPNDNAQGKDVATANSGGSPLTLGMFRMSKGEALPYSYSFDEFKVVLEGEITVSDDAGNSTDFVAGDVMKFGKDTNVTFSTKSSALMVYVAQRDQE